MTLMVRQETVHLSRSMTLMVRQETVHLSRSMTLMTHQIVHVATTNDVNAPATLMTLTCPRMVYGYIAHVSSLTFICPEIVKTKHPETKTIPVAANGGHLQTATGGTTPPPLL